jgi:single-strand DNA-binding protein
MASFNKVFLMGNLTRDPQVKFLPSQTQVAEFGIACNRKFKGQDGSDREEVTFVDITAFGKTAELINQYFTKGKPIFIEGRLKYDQWDDKNGGGKRSKLTVVVDNFQFIGGRDDGGGGGGGRSGSGYEQGGGYGGGGGGGGGEYDQSPRPRQSPPANRGPARPAPRPSAPVEPPPFNEDAQVNEDDIPF